MSTATLISPDQIGADQNPEPKQNKTVIKKLRLTENEAKNLDEFLKDIDISFSEFVRDAISLRQSVAKATNKRKVVTAPQPKLDPDLLLEIGRIGNNINQIAKVLNIIRNNKDSDLSLNFSFIECLQTLKTMQTDLHEVVGELPKINRTELAVNNARKRAVEKVIDSEAQNVF